MPLHLDCSLVDVDNNGVNDCLLLDERGLKVIETISGQVIWHAHSHEERTTINRLDFPVQLPDFNNDNVNELLAIFNKRSLMLICGKSGKAISNIMVNNCDEISNLRKRDTFLSLTCLADNDFVTMKVFVADLSKRYHNSSFLVTPQKTDYEDVEDNTFMIERRKLIVINDGECPNCHASIELIELATNKKHTWTFTNAFVMNPKVFHFRATQANLELFKGHVNGFILKIWQWPTTNLDKVAKAKSKRGAFSKNSTYFANVISERVVLITFNNSDVHVINASLTEINQLCLPTDHDHVCQPDLKSQENSILVGDLDQDGSQELISYSSGFVKKDDPKDWLLISNIKVIRLEAELPKLYGEK